MVWYPSVKQQRQQQQQQRQRQRQRQPQRQRQQQRRQQPLLHEQFSIIQGGHCTVREWQSKNNIVF